MITPQFPLLLDNYGCLSPGSQPPHSLISASRKVCCCRLCPSSVSVVFPHLSAFSSHLCPQGRFPDHHVQAGWHCPSFMLSLLSSYLREDLHPCRQSPDYTCLHILDSRPHGSETHSWFHLCVFLALANAQMVLCHCEGPRD